MIHVVDTYTQLGITVYSICYRHETIVISQLSLCQSYLGGEGKAYYYYSYTSTAHETVYYILYSNDSASNRHGVFVQVRGMKIIASDMSLLRVKNHKYLTILFKKKTYNILWKHYVYFLILLSRE